METILLLTAHPEKPTVHRKTNPGIPDAVDTRFGRIQQNESETNIHGGVRVGWAPAERGRGGALRS